jgi:flagellar export protein FliJ
MCSGTRAAESSPMTIRPRAVRALRDVRERMRDAAAASHATASATREATQVALVTEQQQLVTHMDDAANVLGAARTVYDLDRFAESTGVYRIRIADASKQRDEATAVKSSTAAKLRESTRQLRSAEKLVELTETTMSRREAATEQRTNDDLAGRRLK